VNTVTRVIFGANPRRTTLRILVLAGVSAFVFGWVLTPVRTEGSSMLPTYTSGRLTLVNRMAYVRRKPQRGDIVAIRLAGPRVVYIKRVVGLPGERVAIREGQVYIDGRPLVEPYVRHQRSWNVDEITVGRDEYFVAGDNRGLSEFGSTDYGRVESDRILGRLVF
jgi:signal peptidase I